MLTSLAFMLLGGLLLGAVFRRLRLPPLMGMLIAGIALGPHVLNVLDDSLLAISADLRQIALIIILARAGLSLDLDDLKKVGRPAVLMSFIPACFEMAGTILLAPRLLGLSLLDSALLAAVVASASPAVIVPRMLRLMEEGYGTAKGIPQLILAGDSVDDIFNIVIFTALLGLTGGDSVSAAAFGGIPASIGLGLLVGAGLGLGLTALFRRVHMRDSVKVLTLLALACLLVAAEDALAARIPFSGLLAVMAAGVVLLRAAPRVAARLSTKLSKLWVGAEILLFTLVGASVSVDYAAAAGMKTLLLLAAVLCVRAVGILLCLMGTGLTWRERLFCTLTGIPKATVQAAIGGIPLAMGLESGGIILAVAVVAILFTAPLGALALDSTYRHLLDREPHSAAID